MSTKNNPGLHDCYEKAGPDEPMFVLLGRDRHASALVMLWALMREKEGEDPAIVAEARECATQMAVEALQRGKPVINFDSLINLAAAVRDENRTAPPQSNAGGVTSQEKFKTPVGEGDIVVIGKGQTAKLVRIYGSEAPDQVKGKANVQLAVGAVVTVDYKILRHALAEEATLFHKASQ